jgi:hypothetical protein
MTQHFKTAYIVQSSPHDFQQVRNFAERIQFIFTATDAEEMLLPIATDALRNFDPETDVLVPVGTVIANLIVGNVLGRQSDLWHTPAYHAAIYSQKQYHFTRIVVDPKSEPTHAN